VEVVPTSAKTQSPPLEKALEAQSPPMERRIAEVELLGCGLEARRARGG
jgi:hypothetical protein